MGALSFFTLWVVLVSGTASPLIGGLACSLLGGEPDFEPNVSYVNPADNLGWRCYWTADGQRRLGQQFIVDTAMDVASLSLRIRSGTSPVVYGRPFRLTFSRQTPESYQPGSWVARVEGPVPDIGQVPANGTWLSLEFPPFRLEPGNYCFVLEYMEEGPDGQQFVLAVGAPNAYSGGSGFHSSSSSSPDIFIKGYPINFILSEDSAGLIGPRTLEVDQRGGTDYASIASAVGNLRPGDTLRLAPGSGPYREKLYINVPGTAEAPIVIEGNNEVVTGFEPLTGFREENGVQVCDLPVAFPCVLTYQGERLRQEASTGQFISYALLSADETQLELLPGIDTNGWEVSSRYFAVQIQSVSHHIYRNLKASGTSNDGFNLHGAGEGLVFENIVGFQNLDEGFSAHDDIRSEIHQGEFYDNDNGVGNIEDSVTVLEDVSVHDNLGWGLWLRGCTGELTGVTAENNGLSQIYLGVNAYAQITNVVVVPPPWTTRQWVSYKESANLSTPVIPLRMDSSAVVDGAW